MAAMWIQITRTQPNHTHHTQSATKNCSKLPLHVSNIPTRRSQKLPPKVQMFGRCIVPCSTCLNAQTVIENHTLLDIRPSAFVHAGNIFHTFELDRFALQFLFLVRLLLGSPENAVPKFRRHQPAVMIFPNSISTKLPSSSNSCVT